MSVSRDFVRLGAPRYKLKVHLAERVDENKGNAKVRAARESCVAVARCDARVGAISRCLVATLGGGHTALILVRPRRCVRFAQWDAEKALLTVTMPIVHDWDAKLVTTSAADEID